MSMALYRKYRPNTFDNIIGQDQVIDVLKNQIKENKISHAYIFSGVRGTGKTSTAKVFARAINCINYDEQKGPCNECESCLNNYVDTIEIDAASNNSVDNIRQLKDTIMYQPSFGKYKTYIIDEVHMLSTGAFNALLKTLEEPPSHIVFILATTEINKIPSTILSRCQKFEFKKVNSSDIKKRLVDILECENISYEDNAVDFISNSCDGGVRDAISILDQVSSYGNISMNNIDFVTGRASIEDIDSLIDNMFKKNSFECIKLINDLISKSIDVKKLPFQIISRLIDALYIQNEVIREDTTAVENLKQITNKDIDISKLITSISELENDMKYSNAPDILLQAFVIKQCREQITKSNSDIANLVQKIEMLENTINELKTNRGIIQNKTDFDSNVTVENAKEIIKPKLDNIKPSKQISVEEQEQIDFVNSLMPDINSLLKENKFAHIIALLHEGTIRRYVNECIYISYPETHGFHKIAIERSDNLSIIQRAFSKILKKDLTIFIVFDDEVIEIEEKKDEMIEKIKNLFGNQINIEVIND